MLNHGSMAGPRIVFIYTHIYIYILPSWNPSGPHRASLSGPSGFFTYRAINPTVGHLAKTYCTNNRPSGNRAKRTASKIPSGHRTHMDPDGFQEGRNSNENNDSLAKIKNKGFCTGNSNET